MKFNDEGKRLLTSLMGTNVLASEIEIQALGELFVKSKGEFINNIRGLRRQLAMKHNWRKYRHSYKAGMKRAQAGLTSKRVGEAVCQGLKKYLKQEKEGKKLQFEEYTGFGFAANLGYLAAIVLGEAECFALEEDYVELSELAMLVTQAVGRLHGNLWNGTVVAEADLEIILGCVGEDTLNEVWGRSTPILEGDSLTGSLFDDKGSAVDVAGGRSGGI